MQFLIIYLSTILISKFGDFLLTTNFIKDVASAGYLVDYKRLKEFDGVFPNSKLIKYIPLINVLSTLEAAVNYNNHKSEILTQMSVMGLLEEMTEEEKKEFNEKPTFMRAMRIDADREIKLKSPKVSVLSVYDNTGKIWYEKENKQYNILKATGSARDLSRVTQIDLIEDNYKKLMEDGIKYYGDPLVFLLETKNCKNYNELEAKIKAQKELQERLFNQAKAQLEKIKSNSENIQDENNTIKENTKKFVRKL